jgi:hypothetical protein
MSICESEGIGKDKVFDYVLKELCTQLDILYANIINHKNQIGFVLTPYGPAEVACEAGTETEIETHSPLVSTLLKLTSGVKNMNDVVVDLTKRVQL